MASETKTKQNLLARYLPIFNWLPKYQRLWLRTDLIAGLTVVALLIPEGMAYAEIAGMPPQTAFYAAPIGFLALLLFILGNLLIGFALGGRDPAVRSVMGLGTAQRNISAAIVVAAQNFTEGNTLTFILVASILMLLVLLPTAKRLGARAPAHVER